MHIRQKQGASVIYYLLMPVAVMAVINIFCLVYRNIGHDKYLAQVKNLDIAGKQRGCQRLMTIPFK